MQGFEQTIISQYGGSTILRQLIADMDAYIDPAADIDNFLTVCCDVDTAKGFGLDIIGKICGVRRGITLPPSVSDNYFGFKEATGSQPFGQAPFYRPTTVTNEYNLSDDAFRTLIKLKMLSNITMLTIPAMNQMLRNLFTGRGRCYVTDPGGMAMFFVFEFALHPWETAILTQSGALPTPTGVLSNIMYSDSMTFGFKQQTGAQPFKQGTFFNRAADLVPVA